MTSPDPGSFRDSASQVVIAGDRVVRHLNERGLRAWKALSGSTFFETAVKDGRLIEAEEWVTPRKDRPGPWNTPAFL